MNSSRELGRPDLDVGLAADFGAATAFFRISSKRFFISSLGPRPEKPRWGPRPEKPPPIGPRPWNPRRCEPGPWGALALGVSLAFLSLSFLSCPFLSLSPFLTDLSWSLRPRWPRLDGCPSDSPIDTVSPSTAATNIIPYRFITCLLVSEFCPIWATVNSAE